MIKVRCYECGKTYDWQEDPFCPKCGAFNRRERDGKSQGAAVYRDGLNEAGHTRSFLHRELHAEDGQRRRLGLEHVAGKIPSRPRRQPAPEIVIEAGRLWNKPKKQVNPGKIVGGIVLLIVLWNFFIAVLSVFL